MSVRSEAWKLYDHIVTTASLRNTNPWVSAETGHSDVLRFEPDFAALEALLAVPVHLKATSQSGVPALALDVWVAYELRRAGFNPDAVWPREAPPRVMPSEVATLISGLTRDARQDLERRLAAGSAFNGAVGSSANILGKNYVKQVDVGIARWNTGPELMISTKRMDSSFAKNAANRVEESYGDAKNLRLRYPLAALGFVYALRSTALTEEPDKTAWLQDLLIKLGREDDAYDAVALIVPEWEADENEALTEQARPADATAGVLGSSQLNAMPKVALRHDAVPPQLQPGRLFAILIG